MASQIEAVVVQKRPTFPTSPSRFFLCRFEKNVTLSDDAPSLFILSTWRGVYSEDVYVFIHVFTAGTRVLAALTSSRLLLLRVPQVFRMFVLRVRLVLGVLCCAHIPSAPSGSNIWAFGIYCSYFQLSEYEMHSILRVRVYSEYEVYWERLRTLRTHVGQVTIYCCCRIYYLVYSSSSRSFYRGSTEVLRISCRFFSFVKDLQDLYLVAVRKIQP